MSIIRDASSEGLLRRDPNERQNDNLIGHDRDTSHHQKHFETWVWHRFHGPLRDLIGPTSPYGLVEYWLLKTLRRYQSILLSDRQHVHKEFLLFRCGRSKLALQSTPYVSFTGLLLHQALITSSFPLYGKAACQVKPNTRYKADYARISSQNCKTGIKDPAANLSSSLDILTGQILNEFVSRTLHAIAGGGSNNS